MATQDAYRPKDALPTTYSPIPVPKGFVASLSIVHASIFLLAGWLSHILNNNIPIYFIPMSAYLTEVLALATHWAGHRPWISSYWYDAHMDHHIRVYPPTRFLRNRYQGAKKDNSKAYYLTILAAPLMCCWLLDLWSWATYLTALGPCVGLLLLADFFHKEFHTAGSRLERFQWFQYLRALHWHHHQPNMRKNYAIGDFWLDWILLGIRFV